MIPIAKPLIGEDEIFAVSEVLESGMLAQGRAVDAFERAFAEYIGVKHAIATSNGTTALDVSLKSLRIEEGDEVIVPSFTFIASANSILFQGAKPLFVDVDDATFNINPDDLLEKITPRTRAVMGVHLFGHPFDCNVIQEICNDHNLYLIEDAAQAHGAIYDGKKVGGFGDLGCFSFYATKNMTTGEGGMITTDDEKFAQLCRLIRSHGEGEKYRHTMLGYNYRMMDIQAAIGLVQLKRLEKFNVLRIKNAEYFDQHLKQKGLKTPSKRDGVRHVYHQYAVTIEDSFPIVRDALIDYLKERGIGSAVHYPLPIHRQPLYQDLGYREEDVHCPVSLELSQKILSLPIHPSVGDQDLRYIVDTINRIE